MGALCTNQPIQLPDYKETVTGTTLPAYVAAGGKELYEQARELSKSEFPAFQGDRIASYGTDASGNPLRMTDRERGGLDLLATGQDAYSDVLDSAKTMAGTLGGGFDAGTFTGADSSAIIGEGFDAPTFERGPDFQMGEAFKTPRFDREFESGEFDFRDFDTDTARQYQDIFQTSIDPAIEELNRQRDLRQRQNSADAIRAGAFGGSRLGLREATTDSEIARAGSDLRRQAGREALGFASQRYDTDRMFGANRFDTDRAFDANRFDTDRRNFEADRAFDANRFDTDLAFRSGRFDADRAFDRGTFEADRGFGADRFDRERQARFGAEDQRRAGFETGEAARLRGFETDEASRLRASETLSGLAPLAQGLQEQVASGMITAGQAERELDQRALDLAYGDFLQQKQYPFEMLNFAMGALQGVPYETLTRSQATGSQFMQQPSIYGQTLGGLGSLASLYALSRR